MCQLEEPARQSPVAVAEGWAQFGPSRGVVDSCSHLEIMPHWLRGRYGKGCQWHCAKGTKPSWRTLSCARSQRGNSSVWSPRCCSTDFATQAVSVETSWPGVSRANEFRLQSTPAPTRTPEEEVTRRFGSPEQSAKGTGFKSSARVDGSCIGTKECSNIGRPSGAAASRANVGNPTRSVCGKPRLVVPQDPGNAQTKCSASVWTITSCSSCCSPPAKISPRRNSSVYSGPSAHGGHQDSIAKTRRRVRRIATGMAFRRLVAKCLARQFGKTVESVCSPFQFALSTRAGTDCVGHDIRALTDANPALTVTSIDGVGAYDHVHRSATLAKLVGVAALQGLLPFARFEHAETTTYVCEDDDGVRHHIRQGEGAQRVGGRQEQNGPR